MFLVFYVKLWLQETAPDRTFFPPLLAQFWKKISSLKELMLLRKNEPSSPPPLPLRRRKPCIRPSCLRMVYPMFAPHPHQRRKTRKQQKLPCHPSLLYSIPGKLFSSLPLWGIQPLVLHTTYCIVRMNVLFSIYIQSGHFLSNIFQHCFICRPSDSTVSADAGVESRTVATLALIVRRSKHLARSHPQGHNNKDEQF